MLGKLGELLNKDVGAMVKDAGKVLNTDVGTIAKGAGKVLNTDVGTLAKGAGKVLNTDLGEMLRDAAPAAPSASPATATGAPPAGPATRPRTTASPPPAPPAAPAPPKPAAARPPGFDPASTLKLGPGNAAAGAAAPVAAESPSALQKLSDDLLLRHQRTMPTGTSLLQLLPHSAGEFVRPHATPTGELTSDPVSAMYSVTGHPVSVRLVQCWDEEEARERLTEVKAQAGANCRIGDDKSWVLGETLQGLVFAWTRGNYSFTATAPKGEISMVRFLKAFPY